MGVYPWAHGYFKYDSNDKKNNYILSYMAATKCAQKLRKGSSISADNAYEKKFKSMLDNVTYTAYGYRSNLTKSAFAWGVAIHTATDVYAHCIYGKTGNGTEMKRFFHKKKYGNDFADNVEKVPLRFEVAKDVTKNIISSFRQNINGTGVEFCNSKKYNSKEFKLFNLKEYLTESGNSNFASQMELYSTSYAVN